MSLSEFLDTIESGGYDSDIGEIQSALDERKEILKEDVRRRVKEIFGDDAEIITAESRAAASEKPEVDNPFLEKARRNAPQEPPQPTDPLDALEAKMESEEQPTVGRGGAIIGGMRSNDMN